MIGSQQFWDRQAQKYARSPIADEAAYETTLARVRAHLTPGCRMLELGCGTGTTALKLANDTGHITASDISAEMVRIGREKAAAQGVGNVDFLRAAPGDTELAASGPYDVVLAFNLLHLIPDLNTALAAIAPLVRPGGLFISKTFCQPGPGEANMEYRLTRLMVPLMQMVGRAPYVAFMPVAALETAITDAGFTIEETGDYPARPPRHLVVARRMEG